MYFHHQSFLIFVLSFLLIFECYTQNKNPKHPIRVIFTAALLDNQFEMRKQEYLYSLNQLIEFGAAPYIVEACQTASFFDELPFPTYYPNVNNPHLKNKGVNEARLLQEALKQYQFDEDEIIIKLTGRYFFNNDEFIKFIQELSKTDFIVKKAGYNASACFTGCYAAKYKYFKQFLEQLDLAKMERDMINIEDELGNFLTQNPQIETMFVESLNLTANIFGTGECQLSYW